MSSRTSGNRRQVQAICAGLVCLLAVACGVEWAVGQGATEYFVAPYPANFYVKDATTLEDKLNEKGMINPLRNLKNQVLIGSTPYAANAEQFKTYYMSYLFPGFSHLDQLHKLPERRKEVIDDLKKAGRTKEVHDALLVMTEKYMKAYVTNPRNFHPAARFNAMLVIGDLNADEKGLNPGGVNQPYPNPYPPALDFMLAEYQNPKQFDGVRLAALIGILRHAQLDWARLEPNRIPAATKQQISQLMLTLVNTKDPPAGRKPEGHVWMQRRGVEILAALGMVGNNDPVNQAVTGLVRNHDADLGLRLTAAEALGKVYVKPAPAGQPAAKSTLDPTKESLQLAALLVEACRKELDRIDAYQKKKMMMDPSGSGMSSMGMGMSGMGMPGMSVPGSSSDAGYEAGAAAGLGMPGMAMGSESGSGMMPAGPKDPLVELFRRQIKYEIECVRRGITGVSRLVVVTNPRGKHPFADLNTDIETVVKATDPMPAMATLPGLQKSLKDSLKGLETKTAALLPKPKVEAEPVEPESDVPSDVPNAVPAAAATGAVSGFAPPAAGAAAATVPAPAAAASLMKKAEGAVPSAVATPAAPAKGPPAPVGAAAPPTGVLPTTGAPKGAAPGVPAPALGAPALGAPAAAPPAAAPTPGP